MDLSSGYKNKPRYLYSDLFGEQQYQFFEQPGPGLQRAATFAFLSGEKYVGSIPRGTSSLAPKARYLDFNEGFIK